MSDSDILLTFFAEQRAYDGPQQGNHRNNNEHKRNGTRKEDRPAAIRNGQGPLQILLRQITQNQAKDNGRHGKIALDQEICHNAENHHHENIQDVVVQRKGAHNAENKHNGVR